MTTSTGRDTRRTDTREQIRTVALDLFAERGYDGTSLREIAERLGVTKAAVYYHFRTKEEILTSLFDEQMAGLDALVEWGRGQEPGPGRSRALVERYSAMLSGEHGAKFSRMIQSQQALKDFAPGEEMHRRFRALGELLHAGASLDDMLRGRLALVAVHMGAFAVDDLPGRPDERRDAALRVALALIATD